MKEEINTPHYPHFRTYYSLDGVMRQVGLGQHKTADYRLYSYLSVGNTAKPPGDVPTYFMYWLHAVKRNAITECNFFSPMLNCPPKQSSSDIQK